MLVSGFEVFLPCPNSMNSPAAKKVDPDMRYIWNFIAFPFNII